MTSIEAIWALTDYARIHGLLPAADTIFARNALLAALRLEGPDDAPQIDTTTLPPTPTPLLSVLAEDAVAHGLIEDGAFEREQLCAHLMNLLLPPPSAVATHFAALRNADGPAAATDWLYALCRAGDYIRVDQIARNIAFETPSPYGDLEITINLSKPEKDPREIARMRTQKPSGYPRCMLCVENEGYVGRPGYPSHETLRMVPIALGGEDWFFQYSPYSYYPEHCIALNAAHVPMAVTRRTFALLLDFAAQFPHYFIGSNADLPIVGGSILSHDHFQGGRHLFPMDRAPAWATLSRAGCAVRVEAIRWPMTCLRLHAADPAPLVALADELLAAWRAYDDPAADILHATDAPHSTITPIARRAADGTYQLQLVLRNNRTSPEHPLGIFHPHADLHHIKRENIGLIEVMGLFILPGRLETELAALEGYLTGEMPLVPPPADGPLAQHYDWVRGIAAARGTDMTRAQAQAALRGAVGEKCRRVLEDAGVFKATPGGDAALLRFLATLGFAAL